MKKYVILLLVSVISGCTGKKDNQQSPIKQTTVAMVVDLTDAKTLKLWPKVKSILALYHCTDFPEQSCKFSVTAISDLKTNPAYQAFLPNVLETEKSNTNDDIQWRSKVIRRYYNDITKLMFWFYQENDTSINRNHSEVWETIARSIESLVKESPSEKYLLIFSDLGEMSLTGNVYKAFQTLSIEAIVKKLTKAYAVPQNIKGVKVIVVYQPVNREDDLRFNKMFKVYKTMLKVKGALISRQATVDQFEK